jgi:hypothetical protein
MGSRNRNRACGNANGHGICSGIPDVTPERHFELAADRWNAGVPVLELIGKEQAAFSGNGVWRKDLSLEQLSKEDRTGGRAA